MDGYGEMKGVSGKQSDCLIVSRSPVLRPCVCVSCSNKASRDGCAGAVIAAHRVRTNELGGDDNDPQ